MSIASDIKQLRELIEGLGVKQVMSDEELATFLYNNELIGVIAGELEPSEVHAKLFTYEELAGLRAAYLAEGAKKRKADGKEMPTPQSRDPARDFTHVGHDRTLVTAQRTDHPIKGPTNERAVCEFVEQYAMMKRMGRRSCIPYRAMSDRVKLARAIAARTKPRFIEIPRERGGVRVPFTEEQLRAMRGGLTAEEYRWKLIREW